MVSVKIIRELALELPEAVDESTEDGVLRFTVRGKQFAWTYPERVEEKQPRVPNTAVLVIRCSAADKESLLASEATKFFTAPHYDGYSAVLVRIVKVGKREMRELLRDGWLCQVPKKLARQLVESQN